MNKTDDFDFNKLERISQQISQQCKPNPHNYPIVDKWNYKYVYLPRRIELFNSLIDYALKEISGSMNDEKWFGKFCDVKQVPY